MATWSPYRDHRRVKPTLLAALALPLALSACGSSPATHATLSTAAAPVPADVAPVRDVHADRVLVAGDSVDLTLPTGLVRVKVNGPATGAGTLFGQRTAGALHHYVATFTVSVTALRGTATIAPADFRLLAIADQVDGGAIVTHEATAGSLTTTTVTPGHPLVATWAAPFVEGHGELLMTPPGATRPAALWDFRVEA